MPVSASQIHLVVDNAMQTSASAFGLDSSLLGPEFPALEIVGSQRALTLDFRSKYFECKQHDWKVFDWNGVMRRPSAFPTQPLIGGAMPDFYVPLNQRRPQAPYRLARTIVSSFTNLLFGHGRWPNILSNDPATKDFADALVKACKLKTKFIRARNMGGSCGTVGMSWGFCNGQPKVRVHSAKHLFVVEWEDEDEYIPAHVVELFQYPKDVWNPKKRQHERRFFWHRRDWTMVADVEFVPIEVTDKNPVWQIDEARSVVHNDENCHFVWIQNLPDDEITSIDGQPDYAEVYEQLDSVDTLNSVNVKGAVCNLDPTLKLKMEEEAVGSAVIKKGSDNALNVGPNGDAGYLELSGSAVTAGHATIDKQREQVLEVCQCVIPDPEETVGSGMSSVALKIVYAPMLSKTDIMRDQYGTDGILRLLNGMITAARKLNVGGIVEEVQVDTEGLEVLDDTTNKPIVTNVQYLLSLEPRQEFIEIFDENGESTGQFQERLVERVPGNGSISLEWPDYFRPTEDDRQKQATSLVTACGSHPIISQQTAAEVFAVSLQRNPQDEWARIQDERARERKSQLAMTPGTGGEVDSIDELPDGAKELDADEEVRLGDDPENGSQANPPVR